MSTSSNGTRKSTSGSSGRVRSSSSHRQNSKRNNILIAVLSIVVIVSIIGGFLKHPSGSSSSEAADTSGGTTVEVQQESEGTTIVVDENSDALQQNAYPEINTLISNYRKAFLEGNTELLQEVYDSDQAISEDILTATSKIIEAYNNTQVYTKHGRNTGEYVVFVYDELQIANIKTAAPNLSVFYVKTNDEGNVYIYRGDYNSTSGTFTYDADTQAFIESMYEDTEVNDLITSVNTKMDSACANDSDLMEFMQKVRAKASTVSSGTTDVTAAEETTTESETTSETEIQDDVETEADDAA